MEFQTSPRKFSLIYKVIVILGCIAMVIGLSGYVYIGSFMRYSGDDYCYGAILTKYGFWGAQVYSYNNPVPYHGNRFSLTLFSDIFGLFNPSINGFLPGLAIASWVVGMFFLIRLLLRKSRFRLSHLEILLISEFMVFITLYTAPDLHDSLYWRSGMLPYLAPIILDVYLAWLVMVYKPRTQSSIFLISVIFLLALLGGGFSETATGMQFGLLVFWFIATLLNHRESYVFSRSLRVPLSFAITGTAIATILLISSPEIETELSTSGFTENILSSSILTLQYAWDFILDSLRSLPLPHIIILGFFAVMSFLVSKSVGHIDSQEVKKFLIYGGWIAVASYFLIACCIAPAAFVRSVKPNPRGLIITRFIMLVDFAFFGWFIGQLMTQLTTRISRVRTLLYFGSFMALILLCMYPLRAAINTYSGTPHFQKWANLWDIRDINIREAKAQDIQNVEVMHLDNISKWGGELTGDPNFWYNQCAAGYYGVESISATISVWDK